MMPIIDGGAGAATVTYIGRNDAGSGSTQTFAGQAIGTAAPNRYVIVSVAQNSGTRLATPTVTVGGISATAVVALRTDYSSAASTTQALFIAAVPTGTTADVVVTWSTTVDFTAIAVWAAYGINPTAIATATSGADPASFTVNVPSGGIVIAAVNNTQYTTSTWAGATENYDNNLRSFYNHTGASGVINSGGTVNIQCDIASPNVQAGVAASWGI
jgi:hypothetical protein